MDQINWQHPTGNKPRTANLVCLGPSKNSYMALAMQDDLTHHPADEVWTLNRGIPLFEHDLGFVMDHIQGEADKFPAYGAALWKHNKPIITSDNCDGWPDHISQYPFRQIWNWIQGTVGAMHGDWWHNSVAYIVAYAGYIGLKELRVFGADYAGHSSGPVEDGHPCVAYWCGVMERAGLVVKPVESSAFLGSNQRNWIYGYQKDPRHAAKRARFRDLVGLPPTDEATALDSGERQIAETVEGIQPDHVARYRFAASLGLGGAIGDIGCGIGYGSKIVSDLTESRHEIFRFDASQQSLDAAKKHYDILPDGSCVFGCNYFCANLDSEELPDALMVLDYAIAFEVIEHLVDPKPLLKIIGSIGAHNARRLICSVPNEQVIPFSPETAPFHHRHYTQEQFEDLLNECGWRVQSWHGQESPTDTTVGPFDPGKSRTIIAVCEKAP